MPVWSGDASHVFFTTVRSASQYDIYQQELAASGKPEPVVQGLTGAKYLRDVTADGRFAIFQANLNDIWVAPLDGPARPYPLMETAAVENHARVSPNGNWLAYSATEVGGTSQIYVTTFPVPGARQRVSVSGGADPQWRGDGQELYFAASNGMLMSVAVSDGATLELGTPEPMFRISPDPWSLSFGSVYAPAPDGQKFLVSETVGNSDVRLIVMLNWSVVTPDR
jgi:Tol biopolymer transport system component